MYRPAPTTKKYPAPNVTSVEVKKLQLQRIHRKGQGLMQEKETDRHLGTDTSLPSTWPSLYHVPPTPFSWADYILYKWRLT